MPADPTQVDAYARVVEPAQAINNVETVLRGVIAHVLEAEFGAGWVDACGTPERIEKWRGRQEEERKRRDGTVVEERLLYFSDFTDLLPIVRRHWTLFKPCLGSKKTFETYMGRLEDFRNAPMHSRQLVDFERRLIEGMTGEIRNKVTLFETEANAADRHFPRIEYVRDSFGREVSVDGGITAADITVHPGDEVVFDCSGWDPEDHPLHWEFQPLPPGLILAEEGATCRIVWEASEQNIGEGIFVRVLLMSDRAYHRNAVGNDGVVIFRYNVLPR